MPKTNKLIAEPVVEAPFFSCHPSPPCLHVMSSSLILRQSEKPCHEASAGGASHQAKQPSATLIGFGSQQATRAELLVSLDATMAKVMLDGMARVEGSGTPSGQLVPFQDIVSLWMGPGWTFEEKKRKIALNFGFQ